MRKRISYHVLLAIVILLVSVTSSNAQETTVEDSVAVTDEAREQEDEGFYPDTLKRNYRSVVFDSMQAINRDKGFYYKTYLDSLLRAYQLKLAKVELRNRMDSLRRDSLIRAGKIRPDEQERDIDLSGGGGMFSSPFGMLFLVVAIALFVFIVFKLFISNSYFFSRNRRNVSADITVSTDDNANDLNSLLRNAIKNGNYRLAVRYLYLQSLELLAERKFIEINSNKTNYEYVSELRKHKFVNDFASLTLQYEYVWYGEYPVDTKLFDQIQDGFTRFNKLIK